MGNKLLKSMIIYKQNDPELTSHFFKCRYIGCNHSFAILLKLLNPWLNLKTLGFTNNTNGLQRAAAVHKINDIRIYDRLADNGLST